MNKLIPVVILTLAMVYVYISNDSFDPASIRGKRVLITGSSSGIGEQLAYQYSKLGAKVFITARRKSLLEVVAKKCKERGAQQVEYIAADMGEQKDRDKVIAEVQKRFGGLDHLILNHGIVSPGLWLGTKQNMTTLDTYLNVNFLSFVDLASQSLAMLTESRGNIGVVSSIAGKFPFAGFTTYTTTKHAMQGFFSALRQELLIRDTGISVTTCVIGPVDTDIMELSEETKKEMRDKFYGGYNLYATAEDTAVAIMKGVTNRAYEIFYGRLAWVMVTVHKIIPKRFEDRFGKRQIEMWKYTWK